MRRSIVLFFIIMLVGTIFFIKQHFNSNAKIDNSVTQVKTMKEENMLSMMLETSPGSGSYELVTRSEWPTTGYVFNPILSRCKNGSELSWDDEKKIVTMSGDVKDKCYVYFETEPGYLTILNNNGGKESIVAKGNPTFSSVSTTNQGMYAALDDLGTSYYFRGAVNNNWVKFGKDNSGNDIYWRIIRINGDNSIRMIYSGTAAPVSSTSIVMTGTGTQINSATYNYNIDGKAEYVGYQSIDGQQHGYGNASTNSSVRDSVAKQEIDKWYANTTMNTDASIKKLVADAIYCNDRSASSTKVAYSKTAYTTISTWNSNGTLYYFGGVGRTQVVQNPILACPTESDMFTVGQITLDDGTKKGNSALTYPVGLVTIDENVMAGAVNGKVNKSYYLYTGQAFWTMSPRSSGNTTGYYGNFGINNTGGYGNYYVHSYAFGLRPVISLSSQIKLSGNGTYNNVYEVH